MRSNKTYVKRIISCILAASLIFSVTPVTAIDATGEAEITVTDVPVISEETIPVESGETVTETTVPEIFEIPETSDTVTETLDFIDDENDFSFFSVAASPIQLSKVSETDTSVTISWSGVYGETFSHYEVYCNGAVVQTGITDTTYTVTGLAGGNEYGVSVYAYDVEGNIIGMSDTEYFYTNWTVSGDTVLTSDKIVSNLYINSGTLNLNGYALTVNGNVYLGATGSRTYLNINNGKLYVDGNFNMCRTNGGYGEGYLTMNNAEDYVCVNGDFYVYTYYNYSSLTNGTLEVKGNFTQRQYSHADNFNPSGNHRVLLSGESLQTISFAKTESRFNILEVRNYSADGVVFSTPVTMNKYIDNGCNVTFSNGERTGWTLETDETIEGDLNLSTGVLNLNGHKLTITGNLIHSGGTVLVNDGELEVQGDYRVQALNGTSYTNSTGVLNMTNEADTVRVMGQFVMQSTASHSGKLTAGTLEIGGNLTQVSGANNYNFCTSESHTVVLNGSEKQTVSIANYGRDYSRFNNLKITNTSADGVDFVTRVYVVGNLYNTETQITNGSNIYIPSTTVFVNNAWNYDISLCENRTLSDDMEIGGTLYLNGGTLNLNGHTLTVKGNVYLGADEVLCYINVNKGKLYVAGNFNMCKTNESYGSGYLTMANAEDYVCVNGDFYVYTYRTYSTLTNGTIEVKGNFIQRSYDSYSWKNFTPSGSHKVVLSGEGLQTIDFARAESCFNILEIRNYSEEGVVFKTSVTIVELIDNNCNVSFPNGERSGWTLEQDETIDGNINLGIGTLDLNGHKLTITGNLIHSGGTVLVNGGELEVQGDYRVQALNGTSYTNSTGVLNMTNEADTVRVMGQFVMQSTASHIGKLTAGTLEIGGNLTQTGANSYNFCTSGSHTVILNGSEKQTVSINSNSRDCSRINNLKITNTSEDGVNFAKKACVIGDLYNTETKVTNGANLVLSGTFADNAWNHDIWLNEDRTLSEDLEIGGTLYLDIVTLNLNGHTLTVKGNVYLGASGSITCLNINKGKLYVDGNFNMCRTNRSYSSGYLTMTNAEDYICVKGNFYAANSYTYSEMTDGILEVKGNFTQIHNSSPDIFNPSENHKVILSGESLQTISFDGTESRFNILEIQNYSNEGVSFVTTVTIVELIDNGCNVSFANGERSGWTLEADETIEGDINLSRGTLNLNGHKLTITGNLIHSGGTVLVNGGELEVQGDYRVQALNGTNYTNSTGVLNMTNEADTVRVMGQFVMQSTASHSGKLTAGTLEIGGNLTQVSGANNYNFCTSGSHTVVLNGSEKQTISIANNSKDYSRINNLKITNTSEDGVNFSSTVYVIGNLYNTETRVTNGLNLVLTGAFADNAWNHDIWLNENRALSEDLEIGGTLYLNGGTLNLNGHTLTVKGNVYLGASTGTTYLNINKGKLYVDGNFNMRMTNGNCCYGYLIMTNAEDYVCVNGDFNAFAYYNYSKLTDGTLEVKGNFTQGYSRYADHFAPSGNHKVILSGGKLQKIDFATTQSQFNILEITKPIDTGYVFSRIPLWNELIEGKADTEAPTAPKNLKFVRSNSSSISMTWSASTDNAAVYCYYIYRNDERVGNTTKTEYIDNDLKSHTYYEYYIVACDTSGNLSEWSNILEASTDVDAFAPTQPANLAAKVQSEGVVRLSWTASSDNGTVVKYNVYRNGTLIGSSNGTAFTDSTAFGGYYEYYVEAVDNEDNVSRASASVFIDNLAPSAPVLTLNYVKDDYVSLSWECSDNVGISKYDLYRNDVKIKSFNANMYIDTSVSLDTNYTYYVVAYDAAGNVSENSNEVTVYTGEDDVAPVISSIEYTGKPSFKNTVITVSATDNCGVSKIYLKYSSDKINWTDCGSEIASGKAAVTVRFGVDTSEMTDGTVYLCAYAEDINGNVSAIENSPVYSFTVDNTAPDAPADVVCTSEDDTIEVKWNAGGKDVSYFRIYRKTGDGEYSLIKDNYRYINYFESDIELGTVYTYKITAVDENGNESDFSDEVTGCISDDNTKPQVFSVYPASGSKIGENPEISVSCYDNFKLKEVTVQGKSANADEWSDLYYKEISTYAEVISFTLDTSEFETGKYQIKVSLTDSALNKSEDYIATYDYRKCTLSSPVLTAEGAGWSVNLSWTMENTEEIAGYYVYRRSSSSSKYSVIGSTTKNTVTDYNVTAGQKYYYYVEAMDVRGNKIKGEAVSAVPTSEDTIAPTAYAGEGLFGIAGKAVSFDGTGSTDNHYVASYKWDFGDGTTSTEARPKHTYSEAGTYKVSLTVYDSAENSDTHTTEVEIYGEDYNAVKLRVRGSDGSVLSGARVYCELSGGKIDANTDSTGCYDFIAKKGSYDVYFYIAGYLPKMVTISVTGEASVVNVTLPKGEVVVGELTTRPLELKEILALGIDPKAPENRSVCEYTVNLTYNQNSKTLWLTTNAKGEIIKINETFNENWQVVAKTIGSSRSGGGGSGSGGSKSIALFSITTEISWLKEFYNVDLTVINNADDNFTLENCTADLTLPNGLSLAKTERGESSHIKVGIIAGGETKTMSWVVRGDKKGEYYLSADFNCVLTPFMEEIKLEFKNEKALVVYGGDALELDVDYTGFDPNSDYWTAKFTLTNVSDKPVYDVDIDFRAYKYFDDIEISDMILKYPSGYMVHIPWTGKNPNKENMEEYLPILWENNGDEDIYMKTLKPGEYITGYYSVSNFQHHIPR